VSATTQQVGADVSKSENAKKVMRTRHAKATAKASAANRGTLSAGPLDFGRVESMAAKDCVQDGGQTHHAPRRSIV
jgi:hypothetical protein